MELPGEIPNSELHFFIKQRRAKHFGWLSGAGIYHAARAEGRSSASSADQGPSTPRSKHSATEQRRRAKINDRLEILREILPHCDQKRDKASFLLEAKVYYRPCWRNTQNNSQVREGDLSASVQDMNKEQCGYKHITVAPAALFSIQSVRETSTIASSPHMVTGTTQNWAKNSTPSNPPPWLSMSTMRQYSDSGNRMISKNCSQ